MNILSVAALAQISLFNIGVGFLATRKHPMLDELRMVTDTASRCASIVMTGLVGLGALYCVIKHPHIPKSDDADIPEEQLFVLSAFLGYIIGDSFVMVMSAIMDDPPHISNIIHHVLCAGASACCLMSDDMAVYMSLASRTMLFELSTPFLHVAWISKKAKSRYEPACLVATWISFLAFRVINGAYILYHTSLRTLTWFYFTVCFYLLNIAWFVKLTLYIVKRFQSMKL